MIKTYTVDAATVDNLCRLNAVVQSRHAITVNYLEAHSADNNDVAVKSPVFLAYQRLAEEAELEYMNAKDAMIKDNIPEDLRIHTSVWQLDFSTGILTVEVKDDENTM